MDNENADNSTRLDGLSEENNEDNNNVIAIVSGALTLIAKLFYIYLPITSYRRGCCP